MDRKANMQISCRVLPFAPLALALAYLIFWPVPIDPVAWHSATNPRMAPNARLSGIRSLPHVGPGPESVAIGPDGRLYTGLQDGRVVRMRADGTGVETFVQTGGRPLGMKFDAGGNLIVADAFRGLVSVSPERKITLLADAVNGERMLFPNDIAIAADGTVWFSDASRRRPSVGCWRRKPC
jgi:streptogramin lyase